MKFSFDYVVYCSHLSIFNSSYPSGFLFAYLALAYSLPPPNENEFIVYLIKLTNTFNTCIYVQIYVKY